ncbi:GyrI-like domain-containing protein, partial [Siculibacillus lacustris]
PPAPPPAPVVPPPAPPVEPPPPPPAAAVEPARPTPAAPEEVVLKARPVLFVTGRTTWDDAEKKMGEAFATLNGAIKKSGAKPAGGLLVQYVETDGDDVGYKAMLPVVEAPKASKLPKGVKAGTSPAGKALKFVHNGSLDDLEEVYARIDDWLAGHGLDSKTVVEEYDAAALTAPEDRVVVDIWVFTK